VDFVLVPGVAFTARCERLGYGRSYYDRLIPGFAGRAAPVARHTFRAIIAGCQASSQTWTSSSPRMRHAVAA
jgi:5-formyltetrahydrofolate cyclo-ligase